MTCIQIYLDSFLGFMLAAVNFHIHEDNCDVILGTDRCILVDFWCKSCPPPVLWPTSLSLLPSLYETQEMTKVQSIHFQGYNLPINEQEYCTRTNYAIDCTIINYAIVHFKRGNTFCQKLQK